MELNPEEIAHQLSRFNELALSSEKLSRYLPPSQDHYHSILSCLEKTIKVNFTNYKQSTIRRRIERRVVATHCRGLAEYADYIWRHPREARALFQDVLISVTSYFRDESSFKALGTYVSDRIRRKADGQPFRCWIAGCATGEEAYSIALLCLEAAEQEKRRLSIQLFATDIDEQAMAIARKGVYPKASLANLSNRLKAKYFDDQGESYRVKDYVRDMIVFARHDITQDPPFLKLDLVSCRNVLIYFNVKLQESVLKTFHFSLDEKGILFLGKSEAASAASEYFLLKERGAKIFFRSSQRSDLPRPHSRYEKSREAQLLNHDRQSSSALDLFHSIVTSFSPDSVLLDEDQRVRHIYGEANRYMNLPKGEPTVSISKLLGSDLGLEVSALLHRAAKLHRPVRGSQKHRFVVDGEKRTIQLSAVPLTYHGKMEAILCFNSVPAEISLPKLLRRKAGHLSPEQTIRHLETELISTKEHLQTVIEEHETANEEMQALNEELQSTNEELQSTNEELETTNEELQSANEELTTLNQEINVKSSELMALNQRLQAIQSAIFYPILVIDRNLKLLDFNPAARYLLRITDVDRGQVLRVLSPRFDFKIVAETIEDCLESEQDGKLQFRTVDRDYEIRIQVFRGSKDIADGVVVSFVENTDIVRALELAKLHKERLSAIMENTPALVTMKDSVGTYTYVNKRFCEVMGLPQENLLGKTDEEVFGPDVGAELREHDFQVLKSRESLTIEQMFSVGGKSHYWLSSKFPLLDQKRKAQSVCSVSLDITEKVIHEQQLEIFKKVVSASSAGIVIFEGGDSGYFATLTSDEFEKRLGSDLQWQGAPMCEIVGQLFQDTVSVETEEFLRCTQSKESASFIVNLDERRGGESWVEVKTAAMRLGRPEVKYIVMMVFDIRDRIRTQKILQTQQDELARFSKMASLGEVAAGISHEINTPLNVITTRTDLLRRLAQKDRLEVEKVKEMAADIDNMVESISKVIAGLKSVTRMEAEEVRPHDMAELIHEAVRICDFRIQRASVKLTTHSQGEKVLVSCFPVQIVQILINLINNAVDAVSELRERWIRIELSRKQDRVIVQVTDSGKGIDPGLAEKIMTPFFTTKRDRSGTGLGLSLSRSIARRHSGDLLLDSQVRNTSFRLELPCERG